MWACCADSLTDDDEHNTSNTLPLLFADALFAPALQADLCELDELMVTFSCRFALTFSPLRSRIGPFLNPIIWLTILHATFGSAKS